MITEALLAAGGSTPDFATIAGLYSQLAGVLAGFSFAGLVALIAAQLTAGGSNSKFAVESFAPLMSSFIGLVATSLSYAIIAGEKDGAGRSALLETIGGMAFCVAALMLFYALLILLHGAHKDAITPANQQVGAISQQANPTVIAVVRFTRHLLVFGISPTVILLLWGGLADQETVKYGGHGWPHEADYASMVAFVLIYAYGALATIRAHRLQPSISSKAPRTLSAIAIVIALASVVITTVVGVFTPPGAVGSDCLRVCEVGLLLIFAGAVTSSAVQYRFSDLRRESVISVG